MNCLVVSFLPRFLAFSELLAHMEKQEMEMEMEMEMEWKTEMETFTWYI